MSNKQSCGQVWRGDVYALEFHTIFLLNVGYLLYRGSPTYSVFTTADPTTVVFGLCTCKWGIFALVWDLLQSH